MSKNNYKLIKINEDARPIFTDFLKTLGEVPQILDKDSAKPLVIHYETKQLTYIEKGTGLVALEGDIFEVSDGDFVIFEKGVEHSFLTNDGELHLIHWHWPQENLYTDRCILEDFYEKWNDYIA